ncbi:hypothetical protein RI543_000258 [Arxiozyma heterogenica]|uniref:assimilatory sulfite reductase (NADPH) n=2 Tax=Arxiozyma heterogenica TaxID=278026 RepID=A0AAN7WUA9_9SACH|nr:hypothetical protein RI543_000258 [Kazachstania heterogenica]
MAAPINLINKVLSQSVDNIFAYKSFNQDDIFYSNIKSFINEEKSQQYFSELDIRSGAGLIPSAFISGSLSTIITPSYSLPYFFNTLNTIATKYNNNNNNISQKFHFNVPALNYTNNKIVNDYSIALSFAQSLNQIVITPINSQEILQTTLLSLALHKYVKSQSVLHLFDSINYVQTILNDTTSIVDSSVDSFSEIDHFLSKHLTPNQSSIDQVIARFNEFTGTHLHNFHYSSNSTDSTEEIVFLTYGSVESELFNKSLNYFKDSDYGVLNVRIPIPFNQEQFIANLPSSVKKIIIVTPNIPATTTATTTTTAICNEDSINLGTNFLLQQINATLFYHGKLGQITVSQFNYDTDFIWSQTAANKVISSFITYNPILTSQKNFIYWGDDTSLQLIKDLTLVLPDIVSQRNKFDNLTNGGIIQSQFQFNQDIAVGDNIDLNEGQLAFVQDPSIINKINVVATLQEGSILVINQDFKDHDLSKIDTFIKDFQFPVDFVHDVRAKNIKLYFIYGINDDKEILQSLIKSLHQGQTAFEHDKVVAIDCLPEIQLPNDNDDNKMEVEEEEKEKESIILPVFPSESAFKPSTIKTKILEATKPTSETVEDLAKKLSFKEAYGIKQELRPDLPTKNYVIKVKSNQRVTPVDYDRYIFNIEFDITSTGLKYDIGEALGIHAKNNEKEVDQFIKDFNLNPNEIILVPNKDDNKILESRTLFQSLVENLDLFGKPPKRFYEALIQFVTDKEEKEQLEKLISSEGALELKRYQEVEYFTYVDIFKLYKSAKWTSTDLVQLIAPLKRREYSIASSQKVHPNEIHLLIVVVDWVDKQGRKRFGQASKYISELRPGQELVVSVKPSVMKLPPRPEQPVIMSGLGTGLAPFKAIVEEKMWQMQQGMKIGKVFLFLGSRHRREEYLFGELWEAYKDAGIITHIGAAFSRDQPQKIYIQDRIRECLGELKKAFIDEEGSFYLCGPTWPVPDITKALQDILAADAEEKNIKIDLNNAIEELKESSRYILEVY